MKVKKFQKRKENFKCEVCDTEVIGTGYTNHCPNCLSTKHVDIFPGDRLEECGGIMPVVKVTKRGSGYILTHKCNKCKYENNDHFRDGVDNVEALINVASKPKA